MKAATIQSSIRASLLGWLLLSICVFSARPSFAALVTGESLEACTTTGTQVTAGSNPETVIESAAAGTTLLFRAGTYTRTTLNIAIPSGVTVKPYNCEVVHIQLTSTATGTGSAFTLTGSAVLAGIKVTAASHERIIQFPATANGAIVRNNTLLGGRNDAIDARGGATNIAFVGNAVNSGPDQPGGITSSSGGHIIYVADSPGTPVNGFLIDGNKLEGSFYGDSVLGDDVIAVSNCVGCVITNNYILNQFNVENVLDIKNAACSPVVFSRNTIIGPILGTKGPADQGQPITMGDTTGICTAEHTISYNYFENAYQPSNTTGTMGTLALGAGSRYTNARISFNVFRTTAAITSAPYNMIRLTTTDNSRPSSKLYNNTFVFDGFKMTSGTGTDCLPKGFQVRGNIFYQSKILDNTQGCAGGNDYVLQENGLFTLTAGGFDKSHATNRTDNPNLANISGLDFNPTNTNYFNTGPVFSPRNSDTARDIGAMQAPRFVSAEIGSTGSDKLRITWRNDLNPPLSSPANTCTVTVDGSPRTVSSVNLPAGTTNITEYVLSSSVTGLQVVTVNCPYGAVQDSAQIGGPEKNLNSKNFATGSQPVTNNVGIPGGGSFQFTQNAYQFYGLPLVSGALQTRPVGASVNGPVRVVKGGSVIVAIQIDCTLAACPTIGAKLQYNLNSAGWVDVPAAFGAGNVRFSGLTNADPNYPGQGFSISSCLSGALTPQTGSLQRTQDAVPNFTLAQNQCIVLAAMLDFDNDTADTDVYLFRYVNQDNTLFSYSQTPTANMRNYNASF